MTSKIINICIRSVEILEIPLEHLVIFVLIIITDDLWVQSIENHVENLTMWGVLESYHKGLFSEGLWLEVEECWDVEAIASFEFNIDKWHVLRKRILFEVNFEEVDGNFVVFVVFEHADVNILSINRRDQFESLCALDDTNKLFKLNFFCFPLEIWPLGEQSWSYLQNRVQEIGLFTLLGEKSFALRWCPSRASQGHVLNVGLA